MYLITHYALQEDKDSVTRAMAGVKLCMRIKRFQSLTQCIYFFLCFLSV